MRFLKWVFGGALGLLVVGLIGLALAVQYSSSCPPTIGNSSAPETMTATSYYCYGGSDVLHVSELPKPVPTGNELLVRVQSASVNPLDWHFMRGSPYVMRLMSGIGGPDNIRLGRDFSGIVEAVGPEVTAFKVGDAVFGGGDGAFAQYLLRTEDRAVALKPASVSHAQAAATPVAALTALQALRDEGGLKAGQRVLINGASGGVGTYAVQIAKAMGAHVTGVASARNHQRVLDLGADEMIDYRSRDYTQEDARYDLIVDNVGNHSVFANHDVLAPGGSLVMVAGGYGDWVGPFKGTIGAMILQPFVDEDIRSLMAVFKAQDLQVIADMMATGQLRSQIDTHYALGDIAAAIDYSESGRARGKIIIDIPQP
ncbi:NAD(P)-dependent alcohol dehydrogenase [Halioglobus pacificus]|uniref:NADPH:quinone reductase n=1 Tax=Parahalioglobus pacificus TaxID=930806 RepID=A0A918XM45_9GAMM|nr:NAD(P)-dependent alcohol dehydrogenase [Halioglobus pacificus]GHD37090.1 NADPH:quinone reductase [Halioglobus pacificus]